MSNLASILGHSRKPSLPADPHRKAALDRLHARSGRCVVLLVGPIGSGKSIYAREMAKRGVLSVDYDALVAMMHGGHAYDHKLRSTYHLVQEAVVLAMVGESRQGIILDGTHLTRASRERWIDFGLEHEINAVATVFPVEAPEVHARRRFDSDPRGKSYDEWLDVARDQVEKAKREPISPDEGFKFVREYNDGKEILVYNAIG